MKIGGTHYRTIWPIQSSGGDDAVEVIDQTRLPHEFATLTLASAEDCARAIKTMVVRGAPLIGATAAYGMALAMRADASDAALEHAHDMLLATRPTAVNLHWALARMKDKLRNQPARSARRTGLGRSRRDLRRGCRGLPRHRRARAEDPRKPPPKGRAAKRSTS